MKLARPTLRLRFQDRLRAVCDKLQESARAPVSRASISKDTLEQLQDLYKPVIRVPNAGPNDTAELLGADSISIMQLRGHIQERFHENLTIQVLWTANIAEIAKMILGDASTKHAWCWCTPTCSYIESLGSPSGVFVGRVESSRLFSLGKKKSNLAHAPTKPLQLPCHVLLTCATGFFGRHDLSSLLFTDASVQVTCLIRSENKLDATERLEAVCDENTRESLGIRVHAVCRDLAQSNPPLGLASVDVDKFREHVTRSVCESQSTLYQIGSM